MLKTRCLFFASQTKNGLMKFVNNNKSVSDKFENRLSYISEDEANLILSSRERQFLESFELSGESEVVTNNYNKK